MDADEHVAAFRHAEARGAVVLEGLHAVKHALRLGVEPLVLLSPDVPSLGELAAELAPDVADVLATARPITAEQAAGLVPRLASPCLAVVARPSPPPLERWHPGSPVVVVERPRHAGNLGAVARVAAAAGAAGLAVVDGPSPWDRAVVRASAGLVLAIPVLSLDDVGQLVARAHGAGRAIVALDPAGDAWPGPLRGPGEAGPGSTGGPAAMVAFGSERHGLSDQLLAHATATVRLGMRPGVSSLNLAAAVAATLYALGAPWPEPARR